MMPEMIDDVIELAAAALPPVETTDLFVPGEACRRAGLLSSLTKTVIEAALDQEMTEHLGYSKSEAAGRNSGNSRNGARAKTAISGNCGPIEIAVPRDRNGTFEPQIGELHLAAATVRRFQSDLRLFNEYLCDGRYGWAAACEREFGPGEHPVPICHEWNTIAHLNEYEGSSAARRHRG